MQTKRLIPSRETTISTRNLKRYSLFFPNNCNEIGYERITQMKDGTKEHPPHAPFNLRQ